MNCPKCQTPSLATHTIEGVQLDRCTTCSGVWFDSSELEALVRMKRGSLDDIRKGRSQDGLNQKRGYCPRDGVALLRAYSSRDRDLILDTCPQCRGLWLDGGELNELLKTFGP